MLFEPHLTQPQLYIAKEEGRLAEAYLTQHEKHPKDGLPGWCAAFVEIGMRHTRVPPAAVWHCHGHTTPEHVVLLVLSKLQLIMGELNSGPVADVMLSKQTSWMIPDDYPCCC